MPFPHSDTVSYPRRRNDSSDDADSEVSSSSSSYRRKRRFFTRNHANYFVIFVIRARIFGNESSCRVLIENLSSQSHSLHLLHHFRHFIILFGHRNKRRSFWAIFWNRRRFFIANVRFFSAESLRQSSSLFDSFKKRFCQIVIDFFEQIGTCAFDCTTFRSTVTDLRKSVISFKTRTRYCIHIHQFQLRSIFYDINRCNPFSFVGIWVTNFLQIREHVRFNHLSSQNISKKAVLDVLAFFPGFASFFKDRMARLASRIKTSQV